MVVTSLLAQEGSFLEGRRPQCCETERVAKLAMAEVSCCPRMQREAYDYQGGLQYGGQEQQAQGANGLQGSLDCVARAEGEEAVCCWAQERADGQEACVEGATHVSCLHLTQTHFAVMLYAMSRCVVCAVFLRRKYPKTDIAPASATDDAGPSCLLNTFSWPHDFLAKLGKVFGREFLTRKLTTWKWSVTTAFSGLGCPESVLVSVCAGSVESGQKPESILLEQ